MDERTENRIEGWDSKPLTGGFAELRELADGGFSGVARARGTTLFMLNGRVVGVFGGSIDDFGDAQATAYQAPHPSLPLLFAMKEYGGEQQAKYYTNDTPISEAHQQLGDAQFTGYIELSENVLSGDYYVVYYGGRSMSCAFVGNSERLETGDEAFQLADDEVGIYEVMTVDIEVTDIPEGTDAGGGGQPAGAQGTDGGTDTAPASGATGAGTPPEPETGSAATSTDSGAGTPETAGTQAGQSPAPESSGTDQNEHGGASDDVSGGGAADPGRSDPNEAGTAADPETDPTAGQGTTPSETAGTGRQGDAGRSTAGSSTGGTPSEPSGPGETGTDDPTGPAGTGEAAADVPADGTAEAPPAESGTGADQRTEAAADRAVEAASGPRGSPAAGAAATGEGVPKSEAAFGDLRPIPSLSPDETAIAEPGEERGAERDPDGSGSGSAAESARAGREAGAAGHASEASSTSGGRSATDRSSTTDANRSGPGDTARAGTSDTAGTDVTERATREVDVDVETGGEPEPVPDDAGAPELRQQLRAREERIQELEAAVTDLRVQRDGLTDERDRLESEVSRLEAEVSDLQSEVERLQSRLRDGTEGKQRLSVEDALGGTNLFIRYSSKSGGTLDKAHRGEVGKEEVNNNLRLEHHTQFEADEVVVDDEPFDAFLHGTIYRGFVEWVVRDLLYEIQDTGHVKALSDLYDAIPQIDRAELLGDVSVQYVEDGEEYREQRSFDVVLRDRMGNPLVVANLNDSRNPADSEMMETVIGNGIDVKGSNESLASSMMVTASFFKPGALEAADEAAGGGLLSRESKKSYVKVNRKKGYHLVLVESRDGDFHVNVPEL